MIKDINSWMEWESQQQKEERVDFAQNLAIFEELYDYAWELGVLQKLEPLEGMEHKYRLARALNV